MRAYNEIPLGRSIDWEAIGGRLSGIAIAVLVLLDVIDRIREWLG